jgi:hypothetical protein
MHVACAPRGGAAGQWAGVVVCDLGLNRFSRVRTTVRTCRRRTSHKHDGDCDLNEKRGRSPLRDDCRDWTVVTLCVPQSPRVPDVVGFSL